MLSDVMSHFGIVKEFRDVSYFETDHHKQIFKDIKNSIKHGNIIVISGLVGCGKTTFLRRLQDVLKSEKEIMISKSLSVEKDKINIPTLIISLFLDLSGGKKGKSKIPSHPEMRIRKLQETISNNNKPVALFIDDAHDIHGQTLKGLKRLMEVVEDSGGKLSVVLAGHPKLKNILSLSYMEEVGSRITSFNLDGIAASKREYIEWLLEKCTKSKIQIDSLFSHDAIDFLSEKLVTPLQIEHYITVSIEEAFRIGIKPVTPEVIKSVIAKDIDGLEARLTRSGYNTKALSDILNIRPSIIRSFFKGQLPPSRKQELQNEMLAVGVPL